MTAARLPLSSLRPDLDRGWPPGARWLSPGNGLPGILEQPAGSTIVFPLTASSRTQALRGTVELSHHGGRRGTVAVRAVLAGAAGDVVWRGRFRTLAGQTLPRRLRIDLTLPLEGRADLRFEVSGGGTVHWRDLRLEAPAESTGAEAPREVGRPRPEPPLLSTSESPRFSILTPVHNPPLDVLAETIESVRAQTWSDWELCLVDDGSTDPAVTAALERAAAADERIHLRRHEKAGGISAATNAALEMARGEFVALLDHDDVLVPDALATVAATLAREPETDMLYSDEELLADDGSNHVFAKPHWSPDLLRSQMYTCHLGVYRRSLATEVGGFRSGFDGAQDFDFALRFTERTSRVVHIPRILYRWRVHAGSTAGNAQAKPSAYPAARRAIADHLDRTGTSGEVYFGPWQGIYRVVHDLPAVTRVAVVAVGGPAPALSAALADSERSGVAEATFHQAPSAALAFESADEADVVIIADGDFEPLTRGWLARLAGFAAQAGVAAVAARVVAPDGRVEDGARALDGGVPVPLLLGASASDPGPLGIGLLPANSAAAGGVVAIPAAHAASLGGLDPELGGLAVADFCLRALATSFRVVSTPDVLLRRVGPAPVNDLDLLDAFRRRWSEQFASDPYLDQSAGWAPLAATAG